MSCTDSMTTSLPRSLLAEEEAELARSNKKVNEMHHPSFSTGGSNSEEKAFPPSKSSFKDKLMGEIPGAFVQAFNFSNQMEDDSDSDDEVAELHEGPVAIKLSKEDK